MILTTLDFFRSVLINCINILKFKNNDTNKYECIDGDSRGWGHLFKCLSSCVLLLNLL